MRFGLDTVQSKTPRRYETVCKRLGFGVERGQVRMSGFGYKQKFAPPLGYARTTPSFGLSGANVADLRSAPENMAAVL